jgi:hypothetical protein
MTGETVEVQMLRVVGKVRQWSNLRLARGGVFNDEWGLTVTHGKNRRTLGQEVLHRSSSFETASRELDHAVDFRQLMGCEVIHDSRVPKLPQPWLSRLNPIQPITASMMVPDTVQVAAVPDGVRLVLDRTEDGAFHARDDAGAPFPLTLPQSNVLAALQWRGAASVEVVAHNEGLMFVDAVLLDGIDLAAWPLEQRAAALRALVAAAAGGVCAACWSKTSGREHYDGLPNAIGPLWYRDPAPGKPGITHVLRIWQYATARVRVADRAARRAVLSMLDPDWQWVDVGAVDVPACDPVPVAGAYVRIAHQGVDSRGAVHRMRYARTQPSAAPADCCLAGRGVAL